MRGSVMPTDTVAGCQLQHARRRGSAADGSPLHQDICDISMWLVQKFRVSFVHLWVDRHPFQQGREIACLSVMQWQHHLDLFAGAVREAFVALKYQIFGYGWRFDLLSLLRWRTFAARDPDCLCTERSSGARTNNEPHVDPRQIDIKWGGLWLPHLRFSP